VRNSQSIYLAVFSYFSFLNEANYKLNKVSLEISPILARKNAKSSAISVAKSTAFIPDFIFVFF